MPRIRTVVQPSQQDPWNPASYTTRKDAISANPAAFSISKAASPNSTVIGSISGSGSYSIVSGNGAGAFAINSGTGQLTVSSQSALSVGVATLGIQYGTALMFDIVEAVITVSA